jgi:hypothetical protein
MKKEELFFVLEHSGIGGRNAPEMRFGADFLAVLDVKLEGFEQSKGFLSQAKKEGYGISVHIGPYSYAAVGFPQNEEFKRLDGQVDKMLAITPDSFVLVYSQKGFVVVPGSSIKGLKAEVELHAKPVSNFFKEYLLCFVGDPRLRAFDGHSLEKLGLKLDPEQRLCSRSMSLACVIRL